MPDNERARGATASERATAAKSGTVIGQPLETVIGLHVMPKGPRYLFQDFAGHTRPRQYILIGTASNCDVRLRDATISARHCAIVRRRSRVYVTDLDSTNGVWIAGCRISSCELHAGAVMTIGDTHIAAIGQEHADRGIVIAASTLPEFIRRAVDIYGTIRAAAAGIRTPYSTLRGWLRTK